MVIQGNVTTNARVIPLASIGSQDQQKRLDMMRLRLAALGFAQSPKQSVGESMYQENCFKMLTKSKPELAKYRISQVRNELILERLCVTPFGYAYGTPDGEHQSPAEGNPTKSAGSLR